MYNNFVERDQRVITMLSRDYPTGFTEDNYLNWCRRSTRH